MPKILATIWHQAIPEKDSFPHVLARPTDCFCEPEIKDLGHDTMGIRHKVIEHQDLSSYVYRTQLKGD